MATADTNNVNKEIDDNAAEVSENQAQENVEQDVQALLVEAQSQAAQHYDSLLRLQADMENLRRRTEREIDNAKKFALERIVNDLLPVLDSMEMGLQASAQAANEQDTIRQGLEMTVKMFQDVMQRFSVEAVDPIGQKFNPQEHEAMTMQPSAEHEPNTVMFTVQKGYKLHGRVVRPARVVISVAA
ncbi:MAG: nucleotide exchange factor GrpE [Thiotrichales bacterium]|jgi:molecular chaperone GrpE|nr:nucleotide exchange factor GrpE [Thiotrichales bacterium]